MKKICYNGAVFLEKKGENKMSVLQGNPTRKDWQREIVCDILGECKSQNMMMPDANRYNYFKTIVPSPVDINDDPTLSDADKKKKLDARELTLKTIRDSVTQKHQNNQDLTTEEKLVYIADTVNGFGCNGSSGNDENNVMDTTIRQYVNLFSTSNRQEPSKNKILSDFIENGYKALKDYQDQLQANNQRQPAPAPKKMGCLGRTVITLAIVGAIICTVSALNYDGGNKKNSNLNKKTTAVQSQKRLSFKDVNVKPLRQHLLNNQSKEAFEKLLDKYKFSADEKTDEAIRASMKTAGDCIDAYAANPDSEVSFDGIMNETIKNFVKKDINQQNRIMANPNLEKDKKDMTHAWQMKYELLEKYHNHLNGKDKQNGFVMMNAAMGKLNRTA